MSASVTITWQGETYTLSHPKTTSPSAQSNFGTCPGLDYWRSVAGVKEPSTPAQELGTATADRVERYLKGTLSPAALRADTSEPAALARAALAHLPAPLTPGIHPEEWLGLRWSAEGEAAGLPRIAMRPDVWGMPRIEGVHEDQHHPQLGAGGSGLFYRRADYGVGLVEDIKTCSGYRWSLTENSIREDTQMAWGGLAVARRTGVSQVRLGQPQVDKRARTARHISAVVDREHLERVLARTEALQVEMEQVRAIRDPELLRPYLRPDKCGNIYGRPCPNLDRCAPILKQAAVPSGPRPSLAELARMTGRHERGEGAMAQNLIARAALLRSTQQRDVGGINPPDSPPEDLGPDDELGIDPGSWKSYAAGTPRASWSCAGTRRGQQWNAFGQASGLKLFVPPWVKGGTHKPLIVDPAPCGEVDVVRAREMMTEVLARWDEAEASEGRYAAALAPRGVYLLEDGTERESHGDGILDDVDPWALVTRVRDLPTEEVQADAMDDELPDDVDAMDDELPGEEDLPIEDQIAASLGLAGEAEGKEETPKAPVFDADEARRQISEAGYPDWCANRVPTELGIGLEELEADPEAVAKLPNVGPMKTRAVVEVRDRRHPPAPAKEKAKEQTDAPARDVGAPVDVEEATPAAKPPLLAADDDDDSSSSDAGPRWSEEAAEILRQLEHTVNLLHERIAGRDERIAALEAELRAKATPTSREVEGYRIIIGARPLPGGKAPLKEVLLEDLLAPLVEAACQRLRFADLRLDPKAFGDPYKEVLQELYRLPPASDRIIVVTDPFGAQWKGVRDWFMARRAWAVQA